MRVTIEHREEASGPLQNHKDCYVDCTVEFSQEERAIIQQRDLLGESFDIRTSTPLPTKTEFFSTNIMRIIGRFLMIGGFIAGVAGTNWGFLFFVGIGLEVYGWMRTRNEDKRFESSEQTITIKQLLSQPRFTVHAGNAGYAKGIDDEIREHLVVMKSLIQNSATLNKKQTFDL